MALKNGKAACMKLKGRLFLVLGAAACPLLTAQTMDSLSMKDYRIMSFCVATTTPNTIVWLDNNDHVLMACRQGQTLDHLRSLVTPVTDSQIRLLQDWGLLSDRNDSLFTSIPILGTTETGTLRTAMRIAAAAAVDSLRTDLCTWRRLLRRRGGRTSEYTVLFSYILDDLAWRALEQQGRIRKRTLSAERPFWDGITWAVTPKRTFHCGTNSYSDSGVTVAINWCPRSLKKMSAFMYDDATIGNLMDNLKGPSRLSDRALRRTLLRYGVVDKTGLLLVPVFPADADDSLASCCRALAREAVARFLASSDLDTIRDQTCVTDPEAMLVIAYHEFMWEFMDIAEERCLIAKPFLFSHPDQAKDSNIGDVVYIVTTSEP
ncbi:hypothetical protein EG831_01500 [bacterium]|nr:hypothetical protein [bacterium]